MSASPTTKEREQKNQTKLPPKTRNGKQNDTNTKVLYIKDTEDGSKKPTVRDGIQKEVISKERRLQTTWDKKYGYLSGNIFQQILAEEAVKAGLPSDTFAGKKLDTSIVKHFPVNLTPSPPIPKTSLAFVGWRSSREECRLEFKGAMYISPKRTVSPPLKSKTIPIKHQRFIFLG